MARRGFFLTLEGTDGVGKTTHAAKLVAWLMAQGHRCVQTREPGGGGPAAQRIREVLLDPGIRLTPMGELFLYEAARAEHVENVIKPALAKGGIVVCDRFIDATEAYQGTARGLDHVALLNRIATGGLMPDLTILLRHPLEHAFARAKARGGKGDRLENEGLEFQKRVERGYLKLARAHPQRIKVVAVAESVEETQDRLRRLLEEKLHEHFGTRRRPALSR